MIGSGERSGGPGKLRHGVPEPPGGLRQGLEKVLGYPAGIRGGILGGIPEVPSTFSGRVPRSPVKLGKVRRKSWGGQGRDSKDPKSAQGGNPGT